MGAGINPLGWWRQSDRISALGAALEERIRIGQQMERDLADLQLSLDRERQLRVSAEVLSVERRAEVERLVADNKSLRTELQGVLEERMRSLDALNVRLMTERVEEKAPDMEQFKKTEQLGQVALHAIGRVRQMSHDMDAALLTRLHPRFKKVEGAIMNETMKTEEPAAS